MNAVLNDILRSAISVGARLLGLVLTIAQQVRVVNFGRGQDRLRRKYFITDETPVLAYGSELEASINEAAKQFVGHAKFASTSGSTGVPKRILFTPRRLRLLKFTFSDFFLRYCWSFAIGRSSLYVFSSLSSDESLSSMLLDERRAPSYLSTLQAPYRIQCHPSLKLLAQTYGTTAVRLWILAIANPGVLYSTNPSTMSTFFDDLACNWRSSSKLVRDWHNSPDSFDQSLHRIARRLSSRGVARRISLIAGSNSPLPLESWAPGVTTYICWTGGYVQLFLNRLAKHLRATRYRLLPMYSMSTETVETVSLIQRKSLSFVPLASGVLYEFIAEEQPDVPASILRPDQLEAGHNYSLVVSDAYGLRRYQTGDLFRCKRIISGLPDLRFLRRKELEYSFTGEKLTEEQINSVFRTLRQELPELSDDFLTCVPSHPNDEQIPHYKLVLVSERVSEALGTSQVLSERCDDLLAEINCEYGDKRRSGRLGPVRVVQLDRGGFIATMVGSERAVSWEAQFKFLPLYRQTWESLSKNRKMPSDMPVASSLHF